MFRKLMSVAILIALLAAALPTAGVLADGSRRDYLETRWDKLTTTYNLQIFKHERTHKEVANWLADHKTLSATEMAKIQVHLKACDSTYKSAQLMIANHPGFDAKGKVTDVALATKSVKNLAMYLEQHAATIGALKDHMK